MDNVGRSTGATRRTPIAAATRAVDEEATDEEDESPQVDLGQSIYHEARAPSESGELSN